MVVTSKIQWLSGLCSLHLFAACLLTILFLIPVGASAQELTPSPQPTQLDSARVAELSQLDIPCVLLTTQDSVELPFRMQTAPEGYSGATAMDNEYVPSRLVIVLRGDTIYDSGEYEKGVAGVRARVRGNMTANVKTMHPSVKLKLSKKADLLFRDNDEVCDKEWLLLNLFSSDSFTSMAGYIIGRLAFDDWQPALRYASFVINGVPRGVFLLSESIKAESYRVDIGADGFLIESDAYAWSVPDEPQFPSLIIPKSLSFTYKYPQPETVTPGLNDLIASYVHEAETALKNGEDVSPYFDLPSFALWLLCHDILGTIDPAGSNMFVKCESLTAANGRSSLLQAGPIWDFDGCMHPGYVDNDWSYIHYRYRALFWMKQMMSYPAFWEAYYSGWKRIRSQVYSTVMDSLSRVVACEGESIDRAFSLMGRSNNCQSMLANVRSWLEMRLEWMDVAVSELMIADQVSDTQNDQSGITQVYNMQGILLRTETGPRNQWWHTLPPGCYILRTTFPNAACPRVEKVFVRGH